MHSNCIRVKCNCRSHINGYCEKHLYYLDISADDNFTNKSRIQSEIIKHIKMYLVNIENTSSHINKCKLATRLFSYLSYKKNFISDNSSLKNIIKNKINSLITNSNATPELLISIAKVKEIVN